MAAYFAILVAVLSRILPHAFQTTSVGFTAVGGGLLYYGARRNRWQAIPAVLALMPPPMPVKLFEFAAGVFEMRTISFFGAILLGKFIRFMIWAIITLLYGPTIVTTVAAALRNHLNYVLAFATALILLIGIWVARKVFDRRKGETLPVEDISADDIPE